MGPQHDHNLLGPSREAALPGEAERLLAAQVESFRNRNRRAPKMLRNYKVNLGHGFTNPCVDQGYQGWFGK